MPGQTLFAQDGPQDICIIRLSAIGDVCHAVTMVQRLRKHFPAARITWIVGKIEMALLQGLPGVEFIIFDKKKGLKAYWKLYRDLSGRKFDVLLHMQIALRASLASCCVSARVKIGFDKERAKEGQWMFTNHTIVKQNRPHVLDGFQAFASALGAGPTETRWNIPLEKDGESHAAQLLKNGSTQQASRFVMISAAASKKERNWDAKRYAAIASYLQTKGFTVVLCGGPAKMDRDLDNEITRVCDTQIVDIVGKTTLKQLLAVLQKADLLIAPDTGPTHMAVAVGTPVIGLYAHSNPRRTGPYRYQEYVVNAYDEAIREQYGKPWDQLRWGVRARGEKLMDRISVQSVREKVDLLLTDFYPD